MAGEATAKSSGSNIMVIVPDSWMISPDVRQSLRLSSSTVFMFSILRYTVTVYGGGINESIRCQPIKTVGMRVEKRNENKNENDQSEI